MHNCCFQSSVHVTGCETSGGVVQSKWVWCRASGCGAEQVGVVQSTWVWCRASGCGAEHVGVVQSKWGGVHI